MLNLPKLTRLPQRPEKEPDIDTEIWQPGWSCYCCHDSGIVVPYLMQLLNPDYDQDRDKFPRCTKSGCNSGSHYESDALRDSVDWRIDSATCKKLDEYERQTWRNTLFVHGQRLREQTQELAREKSLRKRDRTWEEEQQAEENHRQVANY